jgi:rRNA small subunit methyltransferase G
MVESKSRKAAFLREVVRALGLEQAAVENSRFEELADGRAAELATVRAVRVDAELADVVARLLVEGGRLAVFHQSAEAPPLAGFGPPAIARLIPEKPSWLHMYARMFHVEQGNT